MVFLEAEFDGFEKFSGLLEAGRSVAVYAVTFIDGLGNTSLVFVLCSPLQRRSAAPNLVSHGVGRTPYLFGNPVWRPFIL